MKLLSKEGCRLVMRKLSWWLIRVRYFSRPSALHNQLGQRMMTEMIDGVSKGHSDHSG
jgi:hypothetical protein